MQCISVLCQVCDLTFPRAAHTHVRPSLSCKYKCFLYDVVSFSWFPTLLTLPPHCSHVLQPLDVTVFGPFKKAIGVSQNDWLFKNPGGRISIKEIAALSRRPYEYTFTPDKIIKGFQTTGIYPFNKFAVPEVRYAPSLVTDRPGNNRFQ